MVWLQNLLVQTLLYPLRRTQWLEQSNSPSSLQLLNTTTDDTTTNNNSHLSDEIPMMVILLQKLANTTTTAPTSSDELFNLFHGYTMFAVGHGLKALLMNQRLVGHHMATIITHPIMMGVHRVGCDISNTSEWKKEMDKIIAVNGMFGGLFRGVIPMLAANYLSLMVYRSRVFEGLIIPGVSNNRALDDIYKFAKKILTGVFASLVSYPFTTLSLRMQANPELGTSEIITQLTDEGISGIYAGFGTHLACNVLSTVFFKFFDLLSIGRPIRKYQ